MKKILLLGQSGFIGQNLLEYFQEKYDIIAPTHQQLDVLDERAVIDCLSKANFDIVINALDVRDGSIDYFEKRLRMFTNLATHHNLYGKMLYFGSGAEYGKQKDIVQVSEDDLGQVIPSDTYGLCMYTMQQLASQLPNVYNFRLFGIFGKYEIWQRRFISNAICKAIYGFPITIRQNTKFDYLFIDDLCKMVAYFIENKMKYQNYNATSGRIYELYELAQIVKETVGLDYPIFVAKDGYGLEYTSRNDRIMSECKIGIQDISVSITSLSDWYQSNKKILIKMELLY